MKNIFAISGSLRQGSSNHNILKYLSGLAPQDINFIIYNGLSEMPAFDPGLDNDTPPQSVVALRKQLADADGIIICTPEYAFGVPGALKNALDWMVSSGSFVGKPTALITASTGGENAHEALIKTLGAIDAQLLPGATLLISFIRSKIDAAGNVNDEETAGKLRSAFEALVSVILN